MNGLSQPLLYQRKMTVYAWCGSFLEHLSILNEALCRLEDSGFTVNPLSVNGQEMLAIVTVIKEYKNFLYGGDIVIHTDHKNLLSDTSANHRVFR